MLDVLLVSQDQRIIHEIQKICAVTGCKLKVDDNPENQDLYKAKTLIVDMQSNIQINHQNVVLVTCSEPGVEIWHKAVLANAKYVAFLPDAREWLIANLVPQGNQITKIIGVLGASGGIGTSLVASCIAAQLVSKRSSVLLTEGQLISGGLDVLWGIEDTKGFRIPDLKNQKNLINLQEVLRSIPKSSGVYVLSTDSKLATPNSDFGKIFKNLRGITDFQIIDFPNCDHHEFVDLLETCDELALIVGSTIRSTSAANQLIQSFPKLSGAKLVIRNLPGTNLDGMRIAKTLGMNLCTTIQTDSRIVEQLEQGISPANLSSNSLKRSILEIVQELVPTNVHVAA